jgi:hypothetical protein
VRQYLNGGDVSPRVAVDMPEPLRAKLARIATSRGVSMSEIIRDALDALPEPTAAPMGDLCSACGIGPAAYYHPDKRWLCGECEGKEKVCVSA